MSKIIIKYRDKVVFFDYVLNIMIIITSTIVNDVFFFFFNKGTIKKKIGNLFIIIITTARIWTKTYFNKNITVLWKKYAGIHARKKAMGKNEPFFI